MDEASEMDIESNEIKANNSRVVKNLLKPR
jgi:hypothetical protein